MALAPIGERRSVGATCGHPLADARGAATIAERRSVGATCSPPLADTRGAAPIAPPQPAPDQRCRRSTSACRSGRTVTVALRTCEGSARLRAVIVYVPQRQVA